MIPFSPFEPDKARYNQGASSSILNVLPSADGYKPSPSLVTVSAALPDVCRGSVYVRDQNGAFTVIAGTTSGLYRLDTSTNPYAWTDISKVGGYALPTDERWSFAIFGNYLIAANTGTTLQYFDFTKTDDFADITGAPASKFVHTVGSFLVASHLSTDNTAMHWSGLENIFQWTLLEENSDTQSFPDGGEIQGIVVQGLGATVLQRNKMRSMAFSPNSVGAFQFSELNGSKGVIAPYSIAEIGNGQFIYISNDGFFAGVERSPIGAERVDDWFFDQVDSSYLLDVQSVVDPLEKIVWFSYRTIQGDYKLLGYDWQLDKWVPSDLVISEACALVTSGMTWDGLSTVYASIDDVSVPFNSHLFKGGVPTFAAFNSNNEMAYFAGSAQQATFETNELHFSPDKRTFVSGGRALTDAKNFTLSIGAVEVLGDIISYDKTATPSARSGKLSFRSAGRAHKIKVVIPAGEIWSSMTGVALDMKYDGGT